MPRPGKILVVDDDLATLELMGYCLPSRQYEVIPVTNAQQALTCLENESFEAVVLDLMLPDMNGIEVLKRIHQRWPEVEVIILTAYASLETALEAVRLGAYDYVSKPCDISTVRKLVGQAVEHHRLRIKLIALHALNRRLAEASAMEQVARAVLDVVSRALHPHFVGLWWAEAGADSLALLASRPNGKTRPVPEDLPALVGQALRSGKLVNPAVQTAESQSFDSVTAPRSALAVPLCGQERVLGVLGLVSAAADAFSREDELFLSNVATQTVLAVENSRLHQERQQRVRELTALNKAGSAITSTLRLEEVLRLVMAEARAILNAEAASVLLYHPASEELVFAAVAGPASERLIGTRMPSTAGIAGWALKRGQAVLVRDVHGDPRFYNRVDMVTGIDTHSLVAVPLIYKGKTIGVLEAVNRLNGSFDEHSLYLLGTLANSAAIAIENARLYEAERKQRSLVEQSQAQLVQSEKLAATGRLTASLAHEINNPLQAIHNSLQLMLTFPLGPQEQRDYLKMADGEVERLIGLVTHMLDFARRPQREMYPTDLNDVVEKVLNLSGKYMQDHNIVLLRDLPPDLPRSMAVPGELEQVFLNMVLNAVDAMPDGGTLQISSRLAPDGRLVMVFSDTGRGIPVQHQERLFEPFFSTKEGGTGLGLAVSYSVVERHGGEITVQSAIDVGTTFTIWLPALTGNGDESPRVAAAQQNGEQ